MRNLTPDEAEAVEALKKMLNGIMIDHKCDKKEALLIVEKWIAQAVKENQSLG